MPRTLTPRDVFAFRNVNDPRISPDGRRIVAAVSRRDVLSDERIPSLSLSTDRKTWTDIPETEGVIIARFAPDSRRIALIRRAGGKYVLAVHDGGMRVLHESALPMRELAWSPDGRMLAFQQRIDAALPAWLGVMTPPEGAKWAPLPRHTNRLMYRHDAMGELPESVFHIFVVSADGSGAARQLTRGIWHNGFPHHIPPGLCFTADGTEVLIAGTQSAEWDRDPSDVDIHAIGIADGAVRRLTEMRGPTAHPTPSADGKLIAFTAVHERGLSHQLRRLYVMPAGGGAAREILPQFDRSIDEVVWSNDGEKLFATYGDAGATHIAAVSLGGGITVLARDASSGQIEKPYGGGTFSVSDDGSVAYVRSAVDVPSEVAVIAPRGEKRTLTALNAGLADEVGGFQPAEEFWVDGGGGRRVQCWMMLPKGQGPHPLVLEIHGGPYAQYGARFSIKYQVLAAAGYAVLFTNPAGSTGYGEAFANALHDRFPGPDYEDLMAAVDAASARPEIDGGKLFITGTSGGGVLTLWTITHTHRFRAAVAIKPVVDWQSWVLSADVGPSIGRRWMGDDLPWEAHEKYRARSPLSYAQHAQTPTLLMAGESDSRTPMSETLQMYGALKLAGCETELLRFPGTAHSTNTMGPSLFAAEVAATVGWFGRFRG